MIDLQKQVLVDSLFGKMVSISNIYAYLCKSEMINLATETCFSLRTEKYLFLTNKCKTNSESVQDKI